MATGPTPRFAYNPALDGVRGVAVLAVLAFHDGIMQGGLSWCSGGLLGVDVFFVLSGFLITTLLLLEHESTGRVRLTGFWARRARRLIPALLLLLLLVSIYAATVAQTDVLTDIRRQGLATLAYVQNWYLIASSPKVASPLSHTWSLSIEEQWYIVWPLLVLAGLGQAAHRRRLAILLLAGASAAAMAVTWVVGLHELAFYGTFSRAFELLAGALLAQSMRGRPADGAWARPVIGAVAGVAIGAALVLAHSGDTWLFVGGRVAFVAATAVVIVVASRPSASAIGRTLQWRPLVLVGLVSYGLYLYHWPIFEWLSPTRTGLVGYPLTLVRFVVTVAVAIASYRLVERPIRHGVFRGRTMHVAVGLGACATVGALLVATAGATPAPTVTEVAYRRTGADVPEHDRRVLVVGGPAVVRMGAYRPAPVLVGRVAGATSGSLACDLTGTRVVVNGRAAVRHVACRDRMRSITDAMAYRPAVVVVLVDADQLFDRQLTPGVIAAPGSAAATRLLEHALRAVIDVAPKGATVVLADAMPCPEARPTKGLNTITSNPARRGWLRSTLRQVARSTGRVRYRSMTDAWCARSRPAPVPEPRWQWQWVARTVTAPR